MLSRIARSLFLFRFATCRYLRLVLPVLLGLLVRVDQSCLQQRLILTRPDDENPGWTCPEPAAHAVQHHQRFAVLVVIWDMNSHCGFPALVRALLEARLKGRHRAILILPS